MVHAKVNAKTTLVDGMEMIVIVLQDANLICLGMALVKTNVIIAMQKIVTVRIIVLLGVLILWLMMELVIRLVSSITVIMMGMTVEHVPLDAIPI